MLSFLRECLVLAGIAVGSFLQLPSPPTNLVAILQDGPAQTGATASSGSVSYTLNVSVAGSGGGTVTGTNCSTNSYVSGTTIGPCTANPSGGSTFTSWTGCASSSGNVCNSFSLTTNTNLVANFTGGSGGTYTAASANESDVNAVINGPTHTAVNGDTIKIPCSGSSSVIWSSTLTVTANITLTALGGSPNSGASTFGSGSNCLTILDNNGSGPLFNLEPTYSASSNVTVLQNMNLDPINSSTSLYSPIQVVGVSTASGFPQVRIDNIYFGHTTPWTESGNSSNSVDMIRWAEAVGVMDHNTIPTGSTSNHLYSAQMASYLGVGQYGDNSWAQPDTMGSATNAFAENN